MALASDEIEVMGNDVLVPLRVLVEEAKCQADQIQYLKSELDKRDKISGAACRLLNEIEPRPGDLEGNKIIKAYIDPDKYKALAEALGVEVG